MATVPPPRPKSLLACFPFAVGHGQEGVCLLLYLGPYRLLLDCGLRDLSPLLNLGGPPADWVICSHAHADHGRGLAELGRHFPRLPIYASAATTRLLPRLWPDQPAPDFQTLPWRSPVALAENLTLELLPAGHLPGAALTLLTYTLPERTYRVLYTGDFCLSNLQLAEGVDLEALRGLRPDVLIIESSLGARRYPHRRQQEKHFLQLIDQALQSGRSVLLPLQPLGPGQEILKLLRSHHQFTGRDLDLWASGALADYCDLYLDLLEILPANVQNFAQHQPLFWDDKIYPRLGRIREIPFAPQRPGVVLTEDWSALWPDVPPFPGRWTALLPEGAPVSLPPLPQVNLETYTLTDHSDGRNTSQLIHNLRPQHIVFVHGAAQEIQDLTSLEELQSRYQLHSPRPQTWVDLPIGERFLQPTVPLPARYEGEVNELSHGVSLTLDAEMTQDPRWAPFADTGLVEARWRGEELVLRGVSQRELLKQRQRERREELDSCQRCRHYRQGRCWNSLSPLGGLAVTPEGYCPVFEGLSAPAQ